MELFASTILEPRDVIGVYQLKEWWIIWCCNFSSFGKHKYTMPTIGQSVIGSRAGLWMWGTDATSCCWGSHASAPWRPPWWEGRRSGCCRCKKWCRWNQQMLHGPAGIVIRIASKELANVGASCSYN
jgi:hypothetical protein